MKAFFIYEVVFLCTILSISLNYLLVEQFELLNDYLGYKMEIWSLLGD
jgi:hypothetical protein